MPGTFVGNLPVVVPVAADWAMGVDQGDPDGKLFTIPKLLSVMGDNFAEIRSNFTVGHFSSAQTYSDVTRHVAEFAVNNAMSKAVAGDPDAGTVLTADAANNKLIIPPYTRVLIMWQKLIVPDPSLRTTGGEVPQSWLGVVDVDGVADSNTGGAGTGASHADPGTANWNNLALSISATGVVENTTASAVDAQLFFANGPAIVPGDTPGAVGAGTWFGFLRAIWMGDLTP